MKTIKLSILLLVVAMSGFTQNSGEISLRRELSFENNGENEAIKEVVEKETQSFLDRDAASMISCHANKPYSVMLVAESGNVHYSTNPNADMDKSIRTLTSQMGKPSGESFKNSGYVIHVTGNSAFTYFDQTVTAPNGSKTNFHEVRYLEKIEGNWKIVYVGAVGFVPDKK